METKIKKDKSNSRKKRIRRRYHNNRFLSEKYKRTKALQNINISLQVNSNSLDRTEEQQINSDSSIETLYVQLSKTNSGCELFNLVYSGRMVPSLPNRFWSIHYVETPVKCIIISEMKIRYEIDMLIPVHTKQIVFDEEMNYNLFFFNSKASITNTRCIIETLKDMTRIISLVNEIKLCDGGPSTFLYANAKLECAYRDSYGRWRHNLCSLEVTNTNICESCLSLLDILHRKEKRNKSLTKEKHSMDTVKRKEVTL